MRHRTRQGGETKHIVWRSLPWGVAATLVTLLVWALLPASTLYRLVPTSGGYTYRYPRPRLTVDNVVVSKPSGRQPAKVLLIRRKNPPFQGYWALPGGFVNENEPLPHAAARELKEETGLDADKDAAVMTQVGTYGDPGREPRGWVVDVVYAYLVSSTAAQAADDAAEVGWHSVLEVPKPLAVDHQLIVREAFRHLAQQSAAHKVKGLADQLKQGAARLDGPWQHTEGEQHLRRK